MLLILPLAGSFACNGDCKNGRTSLLGRDFLHFDLRRLTGWALHPSLQVLFVVLARGIGFDKARIELAHARESACSRLYRGSAASACSMRFNENVELLPMKLGRPLLCVNLPST